MKNILFTCEHGGNDIPEPYQALFEPHQQRLHTHRGIDFGALELSLQLQNHLGAPLVKSTVSRLLVELNRSLHHPRLFSDITRVLPKTEREKIIQTWYLPYRKEVEQLIEQQIKAGALIHISVHSFTPELDGQVRNCDIGLLYDPQREAEKTFCAAWKKAILATDPALHVRYNYPYKGTADGFTAHLRKKFPRSYAGIELEVNQGLLLSSRRQEIIDVVVESVKRLLEQE